MTQTIEENQLRVQKQKQKDRRHKTQRCWGGVGGVRKIREKQTERRTQTYGDEMTRRRGGMEVLPFGGRGFLRVHGHERCLLAARWPRDHRRRRNRTESCCLSLSIWLFSPYLSLLCVWRGEGYCLPSSSSSSLSFSLLLFLLSLSLLSSCSEEKKRMEVETPAKG